MNTIASELQQQFPLSSKKYWKKMIQAVLGWYILAFIGFVVCIVIMIAASATINSVGLEVLWGVILVGVLFLFIISFLYSLYIKAYIRRYYYDGEEHFITIKKGVFTPAEIHVQYQKIQDVYVDQDLLDRMMGLYDVHIASATAASGIEAHIDGVDKVTADGLKKFFLDKLSGLSAQNITINQDSQQTKPQVPAMKLSEPISSSVYPLSGTWMAIRLIGCIVSPFIYWAFIIFLIGAKSLGDISSDYYWVYLLGYLALVTLSIIIHIVSLFLWRKNYAFDFTPENIYYRQGVVAISEKHMPYSSIQDVTVQQSFLERIVGLARVRVENAAQQQMVIPTRRGSVPLFAGVVLQGISIADANKITNILKTSVLGKNNTQSQYGL